MRNPSDRDLKKYIDDFLRNGQAGRVELEPIHHTAEPLLEGPSMDKVQGRDTIPAEKH